MPRCSLPNLFGTTTVAPRRSRRRGLEPASTAATPATAIRALRLSALAKRPKPAPPLPLLPRPKLPAPNDTTTPNDNTTTNGEEDRSKEPPMHVASPPSSSGAADVLRLMDALRVGADEDVYISLLRDSGDAAEVAAVHAHITGKTAATGLCLSLANRLVLAYATCGDTVSTRKVFDEMPVKNGITWATMVSTYSDGCFHSEAIQIFTCMCQEAPEIAGYCYDHAIVPVLRSCARVSELRLGEQVHALFVKKNGVCGDIGSSLLQLYCESYRHDSARQLLETMRCSYREPVPEAAWTSFITACHRDGLLDEAIEVFQDMVSSGVARSSFSLSSVLAVCAESENHGFYGQQLHADAIKHGLETNQFVMSGLVHMYAKQGRLMDAARAFEAVGGKPDAVCWNAMAMGYARGGWYREATRVMYQMKAAGMIPPEQTMHEVRLACVRCYESISLKMMSGFHQDITKSVSSEACQALKRRRDMFAGLKLKQEILLCLVDQIIHTSENVNIDGLIKELHPKVMLGMPLLEGTSPASCFPPIAVGYDAVCYSYLWSEVFAADLFATKFKDDLLNQHAGLRFRNKVLAPGGSKDPLEIITDYLGREPSLEPFIQSRTRNCL